MELNETVDHARRAAGHAAEGVSAAVSPRVAAARETVVPKVRDTASRGWESTVSAVTPLAEAAQARVDKVRGRRRSRAARAALVVRRRWPALVGLLAAGVAVGAVAAAVLRRREHVEPMDDGLIGAGVPADLAEPPETPPAGTGTGPTTGSVTGPAAGSPAGTRPTPGTAPGGPAETISTTDNRHGQ